MKLHFFSLAYDSGQKEQRMGKGPQRLIRAILPSLTKGHGTELSSIESTRDFNSEISTSFHLYDQLSGAVAHCISRNELPIVFSGNCSASIGTLAGLSGDAGVIWFDAHADFNTPETTGSGFLDGMGLATITGLCWKKITTTVRGFHPIEGNKVLLLGTRDYSHDEEGLMKQVGASMIHAEFIRERRTEAVKTCLENLSKHTRDIYIHIDLDVLDPSIAVANDYAVKKGISPEQIINVVLLMKQYFQIKAVGIASYDPEFDEKGRMVEIVKNILEAIVDPCATSA